MKTALSLAVFLAAGFVYATELDRDVASQIDAPPLPSTVILKVDNETGEVSKVEVDGVLDEEQFQQMATRADGEGRFNNVPDNLVLSELDQEPSSASWYVGFGYLGYGGGYGGGYRGGYDYGYNYRPNYHYRQHPWYWYSGYPYQYRYYYHSRRVTYYCYY